MVYHGLPLGNIHGTMSSLKVLKHHKLCRSVLYSQSLILTTLNSCFEKLWQELHQLKADMTISPIVLWQTNLQKEKIQLVIHD